MTRPGSIVESHKRPMSWLIVAGSFVAYVGLVFAVGTTGLLVDLPLPWWVTQTVPAAPLRAHGPGRGASALGGVAVWRRAPALGRASASRHAHGARLRPDRRARRLGCDVDVSSFALAPASVGAGPACPPSRSAERRFEPASSPPAARRGPPTLARATDASVFGADAPCPATCRQARGRSGRHGQTAHRQAAGVPDTRGWGHTGHVHGDSVRRREATHDDGFGGRRQLARGGRPDHERSHHREGAGRWRPVAQGAGRHDHGAPAAPRRRSARQGDLGGARPRLRESRPDAASPRGPHGARRSARGGTGTASPTPDPTPTRSDPTHRGDRARAMGCPGAAGPVPSPRDDPRGHHGASARGTVRLASR